VSYNDFLSRKVQSPGAHQQSVLALPVVRCVFVDALLDFLKSC